MIVNRKIEIPGRPVTSRTMIKKLIEISPAHAMISLAHSYGGQCPMIGSAKRGSKSCPYAVIRVNPSARRGRSDRLR